MRSKKYPAGGTRGLMPEHRKSIEGERAAKLVELASQIEKAAGLNSIEILRRALSAEKWIRERCQGPPWSRGFIEKLPDLFRENSDSRLGPPPDILDSPSIRYALSVLRDRRNRGEEQFPGILEKIRRELWPRAPRGHPARPGAADLAKSKIEWMRELAIDLRVANKLIPRHVTDEAQILKGLGELECPEDERYRPMCAYWLSKKRTTSNAPDWMQVAAFVDYEGGWGRRRRVTLGSDWQDVALREWDKARKIVERKQRRDMRRSESIAKK
jgi:hypothetical protein